MKGYRKVIFYFLVIFLTGFYFLYNAIFTSDIRDFHFSAQKRKIPQTYILKIPWILNNSFCEIIDNNSNVIYILPWNFCLITPQGFLGATKDRLSFLNNNGDELWVKKLNIHHDLFYDSVLKVFTVPINSFVPYKDGQKKIDEIIQINTSGKIIFSWIADDNLEELEFSFSKKFDLYFVKSKNFFESTYINGASTIPNNPLAINNSAFKTGNILVSLNKVGLFIIDPKSSKIVWTFKYHHLGDGQIHAARFQEDGTILFFLNKSIGDGYSQIVKIRPDTEKVVWSYHSERPTDFDSKICGSVQNTGFGTTLVTHMTSGGRAFELDHDGKVIWNWVNYHSNSGVEPLPIYRLERFDPMLLKNMPFIEHFRNKMNK